MRWGINFQFVMQWMIGLVVLIALVGGFGYGVASDMGHEDAARMFRRVLFLLVPVVIIGVLCAALVPVP